MACPLVAGACGLLLSKQPLFSPNAIENCLKSSADDIYALNPAYTGLLGAGRLNVFDAIKCVSGSVFADFSADKTSICAGMVVTVTNMSVGSATGWNWSFAGANPSYSALKNPIISYPSTGRYAIRLIAFNANDADTIIKLNYIDVYMPMAAISGNATIVAGQSTNLKLNFTGNSPFSFNITVGTNTISQTNVYANPCFLPVSPLVNSIYSISGFADANCSGSFSGSALVNVTTLTSTFLGNNLENGFYSVISLYQK